jgi:hypothetical protein
VAGGTARTTAGDHPSSPFFFFSFLSSFLLFLHFFLFLHLLFYSSFLPLFFFALLFFLLKRISQG